MTVCYRKPLRGRSAFEAEAEHRTAGAACKPESRETRTDGQALVSLCDLVADVEPEHDQFANCRLGE